MPHPPGFSSDEYKALSSRFAPKPPCTLLRWAFETFGDGAVMGTGFGASGVVLMDLLAQVRPGATVFYLDTDLLFPETYALRDRLAARLDLNIVRVPASLSLDEQATRHGDRLWRHTPDRCCFLRKIQPLHTYLAGKHAWITALRRNQAPSRADTDFVEWSATGGVVKVNPLADWTEDDVWNHINVHDLPYNPLHDEGYPSIGCTPCTAPVEDAEADPRAGRWSGTPKTECGLHLESVSS